MKAYGKINLTLRVIRKRNDGYHDLQMINTRISLYDTIKIKETKGVDEVLYYNAPKNTNGEDLVLRVLQEFKKRYSIVTKHKIVIKKNIPFGAGLGGVSMDIAEILNYINIKEKLFLNKSELIDFSKIYGADIPYGFYKNTCLVEGIGEIITPIDIENLPHKLLLINPNIYISTKTVFDNVCQYDAELTTHQIINNINELNFYNSLEKACFIIEPKINELKQQLSKYGPCFMSGSGSSLILVPNTKMTVRNIKNELPNCEVKSIKIMKG